MLVPAMLCLFAVLIVLLATVANPNPPSWMKGTNLVPPTERVNPHTEYSKTRYYIRDEGVRVYPVAGPVGTPGRMVQEYAPSGKLLVMWIASRLGALPVLPDPAPDNPANEILERWHIGAAVPSLTGDGTVHHYVITGWYEYGLLVPPDVSTGFSMGNAPNDSTQEADNKIRPENFDRGIN